MQVIYFPTEKQKMLFFNADPTKTIFPQPRWDSGITDTSYCFRYEGNVYHPLANHVWTSIPSWQGQAQEMPELKTVQSQLVGDVLTPAMSVYLVDVEVHPVAPKCGYDMIRKPYLVLS